MIPDGRPDIFLADFAHRAACIQWLHREAASDLSRALSDASADGNLMVVSCHAKNRRRAARRGSLR
jgi:hypothetical protein